MTYQISLFSLLTAFVIAFSMFAQKLQNPFLKPTPSFTSNSYSTTSYAPPLPTTYKYSNFNAIQRPKPSFFDSGSNNIASSSELSGYQKPRSSADLGEILMKNPFNRPTTSIFTSSVGNTYVPNNYAQSRYQQVNRPSSYNRIEPTNDRYSNYTGDSNAISNPYGATRNTPRTPRKQDNYLSTSSADSAVTYINKIYEIDDDRQTDGFSVGSNPFLRKNLLQDKQIDNASKFKNSHDDAALKYIASNRPYNQPSYLQNNYLQQNKQFQPYKDPSLGARVNSKEKYSKYGYNQNETQYKPSGYDSKKYRDNQPLYEPPKKGKQYQAYEFSKPYDIDEYNQKPHFGSRQEPKKIKSYKQYEDDRQEYKNYKKPQLGKKIQSKKQYDDDDDKFNFQQQKKQFGSFGANKNYQKDHYDNYEKYQQNYDYRRDPKQNAYKYSFKGEENYSKPIEQSKRSKKQPQRVFFNEQEQSFSDESRENKIKQYTEGPFQTLGGISQNQKPYESNRFQRGQQGSKKLISSQVQEYENHKVEEKLNEAKRSQQKLQDSYKQNSKYEQKSKKMFEQQYQKQDSRQKKSKGPVRDMQDSVPRVLEFNGMVFHRVEVK